MCDKCNNDNYNCYEAAINESAERQVEPVVSERPLLTEILNQLKHIQRTRKGSIGSINTHYLPQLRVEKIDRLAKELSEYLKAH